MVESNDKYLHNNYILDYVKENINNNYDIIKKYSNLLKKLLVIFITISTI